MNRRDFLKWTGALAVAATVPAPAWECAGEIWCGPVFFRDRWFFVSTPGQTVQFSEVQDPTTWLN